MFYSLAHLHSVSFLSLIKCVSVCDYAIHEMTRTGVDHRVARVTTMIVVVTIYNEKSLSKKVAELQVRASWPHLPARAPWPNGYGVGLRIRRLRVRVPSESIFVAIAFSCRLEYFFLLKSMRSSSTDILVQNQDFWLKKYLQCVKFLTPNNLY
jgi:hypothetical protein